MLIENPYSVLSPFKKGSVKLPKNSDIRRIIEKTGNSYSTADMKDKKAKTEHRLNKLMKKSVKNRKILFSSAGQVRVRLKINEKIDNMKIDLFGGAKKLESLLDN